MKGRGLGGKRVTRKTFSLDNALEKKIHKLSISCNMSESELIYNILSQALNNADYINYLQNKYCVDDQYRCFPVKDQGRIVF